MWDNASRSALDSWPHLYRAGPRGGGVRSPLGCRWRRAAPGRNLGAGWAPILAGTLIYALCLIRFLAAGGTPAIFFTRPLRFLIGEEPEGLVSGGLYRFSRNPMYLGVLMAVFGQAVLLGSPALAAYGCAVFVSFT